MKASVIGLGKCGLPFAVVANRHHKVVGIDKDRDRLEQIRKNTGFTEPFLNEYLEKSLLLVDSELKRIEKSEIVFIFVDTKKQDKYVADPIVKVLQEAKPYLNGQVIVVRSTLEPTSTNKTLLPFLRGLNVSGVCYNPTMVAIGSAIKHFKRPPFVLVGQSNQEAGQVCEQFYNKMYNNNVPILGGSLQSVEIAKYVLNLALINRVALVNTIGEYCEAYGGNIDYIVEAFKLEKRVTGKKMLRAGLGLGGPSLPLDVRAYSGTVAKQNLDTKFVDAMMDANKKPINRTVRVVRTLQPKRIGLLGITYKPNVPYLFESQALEIARKLSETRQVMVYDPQGMENAKQELGNTVLYGSNIKDVTEFADVIVLTVEWPQFLELPKHLKPHHIVVDPWRMLAGKNLPCKHIAFGIGE